MSGTEFSRPVRRDTLGPVPRTVRIVADEDERAALAARFGVIAIARLDAEVALRTDGEAVIAEGRIEGQATQACVVTGDPVPAAIDETLSLRFVLARADSEEVELAEADLDTLPYDGAAVDLGEAVAQEFALALAPFPRSPAADETLRDAGVLSEEDAERARRTTGPFAALRELRGDD